MTIRKSINLALPPEIAFMPGVASQVVATR